MLRNACLIGLFGGGIVLSPMPSWSQQPLKLGYAPFNAPATFLPDATSNNYRTIDPNGTNARGAVIELLAAAAKEADIKVLFVPVVVGDQFAALVAKEIDLTTTAAGLPVDSAKTMVFTGPLYANHEALIVAVSDQRQYRSWEDLKGEILGAQRGTRTAEAMRSSKLFKEVRLFGTTFEIESAVANGQIKAGIANSVISVRYASQQGLFPKTKLVESYTPLFNEVARFGARAEDAEILNKIDRALSNLRARGTSNAILGKYRMAPVLVK
jgi:polar amino acid transport system substrate-binding protein